MNEYEHTFFNKARLAEFWDIVAGLLKFASPSVLIFVAVACVGMVLTAAIVAFRKGADDEERDKDFDIKYYD